MSGKTIGSQSALYIILAIVGLFVFVPILIMAPEARVFATVIMGIVLWVVSVVLWILIMLLFLLGGALVAIGVSFVIRELDILFGDEVMPVYIRWIIAFFLGLLVGYIWIFAPTFLTQLPFWIQDWQWFGLNQAQETWQWWWSAIEGILAFFVYLKFYQYRVDKYYEMIMKQRG